MIHRVADQLDTFDSYLQAAQRKLGGGKVATVSPSATSPADEAKGAERFAAGTRYLTDHFGGSDTIAREIDRIQNSAAAAATHQ